MGKKLSSTEINSLGEAIGELGWMVYGKRGKFYKKIIKQLRKRLRKGV